MRKRSWICLAMGFVMMGCFDVMLATDLKNLKGMYSYFTRYGDDRYKELSVLEGAVAWHRGVIRNLYDYAHGQKMDTPMLLERNDKNAREAFAEDMKKWVGGIESPIAKLVRGLFNYAAGNRVATDFKVSNLILDGYKVDNVFAPEEFAKKIAHIVGRLWWLKYHVKPENVEYWLQEVVGNQQNLTYLNFASGVGPNFLLKTSDAVLLKTIDGKRLQEDPIFGKDFLDGLRIVFLAALWQACGFDRVALDVYVKEIDVVLSSLRSSHSINASKSEIDTKIKTMVIVAKKKEKEMIDIINRKTDPQKQLELQQLEKEIKDFKNKKNINAVKDCENRKKVLYTEIRGAIKDDGEYQAKLSEKIKLEKEIMTLRESLAALDRVQIPSSDIFTGVPFAVEMIDDLFAEVRGYSPELPLSDEQLEKFVFVALQPGNYPPVISHQYSVPSNFNGIPFPDCVDHMVRLLVNHLVYDHTSKKFNIQKLRELTQREPSSRLVGFYERYSDVNSAGAISVHRDWLDVISNHYFVSYNRVVGDDQTSQDNSSAKKGFIKLPPELASHDKLKNYLERSGYGVVPDDVILYEIIPSMNNIVMLLNDLCNFQLFSYDQEFIEKFTGGTFLNHYLQEVFAAFGTVEVSHAFDRHGEKELISPRRFDSIESGSVDLKLTFDRFAALAVPQEVYEITINLLYGGHAELYAPENDIEAFDYFHGVSYFSGHPLVLSMLLPLSQSKVLYGQKDTESNLNEFLNLLSMPLSDRQKLSDILAGLKVIPTVEQAQFLKSVINVDIIDEMIIDEYLLTYYSKVITSSWISSKLVKEAIDYVSNIHPFLWVLGAEKGKYLVFSFWATLLNDDRVLEDNGTLDGLVKIVQGLFRHILFRGIAPRDNRCQDVFFMLKRLFEKGLGFSGIKDFFSEIIEHLERKELYVSEKRSSVVTAIYFIPLFLEQEELRESTIYFIEKLMSYPWLDAPMKVQLQDFLPKN